MNEMGAGSESRVEVVSLQCDDSDELDQAEAHLYISKSNGGQNWAAQSHYSPLTTDGSTPPN